MMSPESGGLAGWRHTVPAVTLAVLWALESVVPQVPFGKGRWLHGLRNLAVASINGVVGVLILSPLLVMVSTMVANGRYGIFWRLQPILAVIAVLLLFDLWMYCWHRLNHQWGMLWRFHRVHHTDRQMDSTTALRFHPLEILLSGAARLLLMPLLGMTVELLLLYELILLPVILVQHSNVRMPMWLDRLVRLAVVTPWMHRIHHSQVRTETDSNYGSVLSIWDRLFGSWRWRPDPENIAFGLAGQAGAEDVPGMLAAPFRDDNDDS